MIRTTVLTIGQNKDRARIWIEGKYLEKAGFSRGSSIYVKFSEKQIEINLHHAGDHIVCGKKHPVIDINNNKIKKSFPVSKQVRVIIEIGKIKISITNIEHRKLTALRDGTYGEIFAGGGLLSESAKQAGLKCKWSIEIDPKYADIWQLNHEGTMHNSDVAEVILEELEQVEFLIGGIPCEPFSIARKNKGKETKSSAMHQNIDLSMHFLIIVKKVNPRKIILEEVTPYLKSEIGIATISALKRMGYNIEVKQVSGTQFGEVTTRKRVVIIASYDEIKSMKFISINKKICDVLQNVNDTECKWWNRKTKSWVFINWEKEKAKGNNFQSQIITYDSVEPVQTIPKRYFAQQAGNPVVKHPTLSDTYRWLTLTEVKRIMGLPDDYDLGDTKTIAGEVLGQGVLVNMFKKIFQEIKN